MEKLILKNAEIVFANLEEKDGFKRSLTIKVTPEFEKAITEFWKEKQIGKTTPGVPTFKIYEETKQFNLSFNDNTKFAYLAGTTDKSLGFGAKCDMVVNAFSYNNKFTAGKDKVGASLSAVVVTEGRKTGADADLAELLGERQSEPQSESNPFEEKVNESGLPF